LADHNPEQCEVTVEWSIEQIEGVETSLISQLSLLARMANLFGETKIWIFYHSD